MAILAAMSIPSAIQAEEAHQSDASDFAPAPVLDEAFFGFGGAYIAGYLTDAIHPFTSNYYGDYILGVGYQKLLYVDPDGFSFGAEIGLGGRFGVSASSLEVWGGGVVRYDGLTLFDKLRITPAVTVGLSYVTGKTRTETTREVESGDSADLLFYLGPEISFSPVDRPEWETFVRIQHRSGLFGTLAHIDGANASMVGLRRRF